MRNNTLSTLIVRHGDNLLRRFGWPETVGVTQVTPGVVPGWLAVCGVLSAAEILTLTTHLCRSLNYGRAQLLTASPVTSVPGTGISAPCHGTRMH